MQLTAGDTLLDIGCGTGLISRQYTQRDIKYTGIDSAESRIEKAKALNPAARFIHGDLRDPAVLKTVEAKHVILHGVLHHLSDEEVEGLYFFLREIGCKAIATMDPILPTKPWARPLATILCKVDQGKYVRKYAEYESLLKRQSKSTVLNVYRNPRWPVEILYSSTEM
jgi:2-polyprenyl-3-methyl-5-hydroxy-6-metoxy-1,4-benzoquinol methylase